MNIIDFSRTAYISANTYLQYVRQNGKGRETINIVSIKEIENRFFLLKISKKLYQLDSTYFKFNSPLIESEGENRDSDFSKKIHFIEYDESDLRIIVRVEDSFYNVFKQLKANEILLVSDLSFLIKATRDWYKEYHDRISFPNKDEYGNISLITPKSISGEQIQAVKTVLSSPVSYVWGAPGTGKTQVVLSSCIASIVDKNSSVLVVGPTNNAVEQSLSGIITMLEDANIDIDMILRMGKASSEFSLKYPDLCEKGSIVKELSQLNEEIKIIEKRYLEYDLARKLVAIKDVLLSLYDEKSKNEALCSKTEENLAFCLHNEQSLNKRISELEAGISELRNIASAYETYVNMRGIYEPITEILKTIKSLEENKRMLVQKQEACISDIEKLREKIIASESKARLHKQEITSLKKKANSLGYKVMSFFGNNMRDEALAEINRVEKKLKIEEGNLEVLYIQMDSENNKIKQTSVEMEAANKQLSSLRYNAKMIMSRAGFANMKIEEFYAHSNEIIEKFNNNDCNIDNIAEKIEESETALLETKQAFLENDNDLIKSKKTKKELDDKKERISKEIVQLITTNVKENFDFGFDLGEKLATRLLALDISDHACSLLKTRMEKSKEHYEALKIVVDSAFQKKRIYACTIDHLILHYAEFVDLIKGALRFAFLDEAAYCSMIKAAPLFSLGVPVGFFGDHMQLPPICEMENKGIVDKSKDLSFLWSQSSLYFPDIFDKDIKLDDLRYTYYAGEDPMFKNVERATLTNTYRFGENLARILDSFVYKTGFRGTSKDTKVIVINAPRFATEKELRENHSESEAIKNYVKNNKKDSLMILTPYKKQRDLIQKSLSYKQDVYTIHASQGREWDTVVLSVVDTEKKFFTDSNNKQSKGLKIINTAISRARKELVIVCDKDYWLSLMNDQLVGNLVAHANNYQHDA